MPPEPLTVAAVADDAAALLKTLGVPAAHFVGHSGGASSPKSWPCGIPSWSAAPSLSASGEAASW
jgi:pimeloyl-ACP methyl ester carboxylesterase